MTSFYDETVKCSVCGQDSEQYGLMSTNAFGSPDLDTRPPEMKRSTMDFWLQECPHCGYVASSLEKAINCEIGYLSSSEYKDFPASSPVSELAQRFVKKARIAAKGEDYLEAFWGYLHAAWASDDEEDETWQIELRKSAIQMMEKFNDEEMADNYRLIRVDLLRKTRQFERLLQEYENMRFEDELFNQILRFQILKAKDKDTATYTVIET